MKTKRIADDNKSGKSKRCRTLRSLDVKLDVIRRFEQGARGSDISRALGLPESTVRTIYNDAKKYKEYSKTAATGSIKMFRNRDNIMVKMERILVEWIEEQHQDEIAITTAMIQEKARSIFNDLKNEEGTESQIESFNASKGWYDRFKRRAGLNNNKVPSGSTADSSPFMNYLNSMGQDDDEDELILGGDGSMEFSSLKSDGLVEEMEKLLHFWINEQIKEDILLSAPMIQKKAANLFEELRSQKGKSINVECFNATKGWYNQFKKRFGFQNIKIQSKSSINVDMEPVDNYCQVLKELIVEEGYSPQQVFNVNEIGLFWKRMPDKTFISQEEKAKPGVKASKDRLTLLLGANAAGDFKLKPLLVYHSENPRALKGFAKARLPVSWHSNKKTLVTQSIFTDWFCNYFCPEVSRYCEANGLPNKALLILDNSSGHPTNLDDLSDNKVKVIFISPDLTSYLQPMSQGILDTFKAYYLKTIFMQAKDNAQDISMLREFWKSYNILKAMDNISEAWNELSPKIMNAAWMNLWKNCVKNEREDFQETTEDIVNNIVDLSIHLGFNDLTMDDIEELLASHSQELNENHLEEHRASEEDDESEVSSNKILTTENLSEAFTHLEAIKNILENCDPDRQRSSLVNRDLETCMKAYREILNHKKRVEKFFKKKENTQEVSSENAETVKSSLVLEETI